jgi:hypothetical protein
MGKFNAKAQGRKDARRFFRHCDFGTLRLCVETPLLSAVDELWMRVAALRLCVKSAIRPDRSGQSAMGGASRLPRATFDPIIRYHSLKNIAFNCALSILK